MLKTIAFSVIFTLISSLGFSQENCANGIDDDGDGLIDLNDVQDCNCQPELLSLIPNPSFENNNCCPSNHTQMECASQWQQATQGATSDYFNQCGYRKYLNTDDPSPYPHGVACAGFFDAHFLPSGLYKEYIGSCLNNPILPGTSYTLKLKIYTAKVENGSLYTCESNNLDLTIYGTTQCGYFPINGGIFSTGCPTTQSNQWFEIASTQVTYNAGVWQEVSIEFTTNTPIQAIIIGPGCNAVNNPGCGNIDPDFGVMYENYYYIDQLQLLKSTEFSEVNIQQTGTFCNNNLVLNAVVQNSSTNLSYQWYKNGIALLGQTSANYVVPMGAAGLGSYQVRVSNTTLCLNSPSFVVEKSSLSLSTSAIPPSCFNNSDGEIQVTVSNGVGPFEYFLNNIKVPSPIQNLGAGVYEITVKSPNSCEGTTSVTLNTPLPLTPNAPPQICLKEGLQWVKFEATGGTPPYQYTWDDTLTSDSILIDPTTQHSLSLFARDANGCVSEKSIVNIQTIPELDFMAENRASCPPLQTNLTALFTPNVLNQIEKVVWSYGDGSKEIGFNPKGHTYLETGNYAIDMLVYLKNGCQTQISKPNYITVFEAPNADFITQIPENSIVNTEIYFKNQSTQGFTYEWTLDNILFSQEENTTYTFENKQEQEFEICLNAYSERACVDTFCQKIRIKDALFIYVPNTFTPDGNGLNDVFKVEYYGEQIELFEFKIFDRWGAEIHQWNDPNLFWDGKKNQVLCQQGIYLWEMFVKYKNQTPLKKTGKVLLVR